MQRHRPSEQENEALACGKEDQYRWREVDKDSVAPHCVTRQASRQAHCSIAQHLKPCELIAHVVILMSEMLTGQQLLILTVNFRPFLCGYLF